MMHLLSTAVYDEDSEIDNTAAEAGIQNSTGQYYQLSLEILLQCMFTGSLDDSVAVNIDGLNRLESIQLKSILSTAHCSLWRRVVSEAQDFWNFVLEAQAVWRKKDTSQFLKTTKKNIQRMNQFQVMLLAQFYICWPAMQAIADACSENLMLLLSRANGSGAVWKTLTGANDIGMASRALDEKRPLPPTSQPMALDGLLLLSSDNPVEDLTVNKFNKFILVKLLHGMKYLHN